MKLSGAARGDWLTDLRLTLEGAIWRKKGFVAVLRHHGRYALLNRNLKA
jgi:hypothetical protein